MPKQLHSTALLLGLALIACGDDDPEQTPEPDGGRDMRCDTPQLRALDASLEQWQQLAAESGDTYWYEAENCLVNSQQGDLTVVRIEAGKHSSSEERSIERADCQQRINSIAPFSGGTFESMYQRCRKLLENVCAAEFATDERGVLRTCHWEPDDGSCLDNCGDGVHIRRWGFGAAPAE